jgi:hypothetical protein
MDPYRRKRNTHNMMDWLYPEKVKINLESILFLVENLEVAPRLTPPA